MWGHVWDLAVGSALLQDLHPLTVGSFGSFLHMEVVWTLGHVGGVLIGS